MGVSTDGILCYGWKIEEDGVFPWEEYKEEDWWLTHTGYVPSCQPYLGDGYAPGFSEGDPRIDAYFDEQSARLKAKPMPFELVNYCSRECPLWIVAVPNTRFTAHRGYPVNLSSLIEPARFVPAGTHALTMLLAQLGLTGKGPAWWLCSYWG